MGKPLAHRPVPIYVCSLHIKSKRYFPAVFRAGLQDAAKKGRRMKQDKHAAAANWLGTLSVLIQDRVEARWQAELDLSPMSAAALVQIEQESGCAIELVATRIGLSHSATVRLVDKLVARDLVAKDRGKED